MSSGELRHSDRDTAEPTSTEVQFAVMLARMIDTVNSSAGDMRQAIYDLARYKLQEQFTHADVKEMKRAQQALESAIRGVEEFSASQKPSLPPPPVADHSPPPVQYLPSPETATPAPPPRPPLQITPEPSATLRRSSSLWSPIQRTAGMLALLGVLLLAFQQRERLASLAQFLPSQSKPVTPQIGSKPAAEPPPAPRVPAKRNQLQPQDYGIYAVGGDKLSELQLLPGRAPDVRVAVSAAINTPSQTALADGHPRFIVFRRDTVSTAADRAEVRVIAKVAREFSADAAGKKPDDSDRTWVIRNVSFPFRSSPVPDSPEMYELHSEDPTLELTPGRYALIIRGQAYDFTVPGEVVDPRHCIERVVLTSGTLYTDCKKL